MRNLMHILLVSTLSMLCLDINAQTKQVTFNIITGASGISLGKVNSVTQDKYGFMWFSDQTNRSIVRYDGTTMKRYVYDFEKQDAPDGMGGYYPEWLTADKDGFIWIAYYGQGLDRFDPGTGTFVHYKHNPNDSFSLINNTVSCVIVDHLGDVWVGTNGGLDRLDQRTGKFKHYVNEPNNPHSLSFNLIRSLYEDRQGTIWAGAGFEFNITNEGGLNRFNRESETFTRFLNDPNDPQSLAGSKPRSLFEDSKGNFWVGSNGLDGLQIMDRKNGTFTRFVHDPKSKKPGRTPIRISSDHITFINEDQEGQIWIGTDNGGINRFNPTTEEVTHYGGERNISGDFIDISTWCIGISNDGLVWIGTQGPHLYKVDLANIYIPHTSDGLTAVCRESESIWWYATDKGVERRDLQRGTIQIYKNQPGNKHSLDNIGVRKIVRAHDGTMWLATNFGWYRYNPVTNDFTHFLQSGDKNQTKYRNVILDMLEDQNDFLWLTSIGGLSKFDPASKVLTDIALDISDSISIGSFINTIENDPSDVKWIGAEAEGIISYDNAVREFRQFLKGLIIYDLFRDRSGMLWAGTSNGLYYYDPVSKNFVASPLVRVTVYSIIEDEQANLWLGTYQKLIYRIGKDRKQVTILSQKNGLGTTTAGGFQIGGAFHGLNGQIIMTSSGGDTYSFDPEKVTIASDTSHVYFTGFWIGERPIQALGLGNTSDSTGSDGMFLAYNENTFSFTASKVDLRATGNASITYMMENYDADWRTTQPEARIVYYKVPPGDYDLRIRSTNNAGQLTERSMHILISPPWWATIWAYGFYIVAFLGSVFTVHKVQKGRVIRAERERTHKKEMEQAREIEKAYTELKTTQSQLIQSEKMASLGELTAGIAHEIQNPLNFVNNYSEVNTELIDELKKELAVGSTQLAEELIDDIKANGEKINHHGKRAADIVKGMLQHSRTSSGQKELTDINALCDEYLRLSYHGLRAKDKSFYAKFETDFDSTLPKLNVVPQDIGRVILNLINNAFYAVNERANLPAGQAGNLQRTRLLDGQATNNDSYEPTVTVSTKKLDDKIEIRVKDNGNGIPDSIKEKIFQPFFTTKPTGQGTGLGLSLSYDIVKAHGGELVMQSTKDKGSQFIVNISIE